MSAKLRIAVGVTLFGSGVVVGSCLSNSAAALCCVTLLLAVYAGVSSLDATKNGANALDTALYKFDHGRLNVALPPSTMWVSSSVLKCVRRSLNTTYLN